MSGNEPNKHKRGEMGRWGPKWGNMEEPGNKPNRKKVTNFIGILGFPDSEVFLPRSALCDSVSFFFVFGKKKALDIGQEVTI